MRDKTPRDPRFWQIAALSSLLIYGVFFLRLDVRPGNALAIFVTALGAQWLASRLVGLPRFEAKSALISSLSLCLLLRTASWQSAALIAALTISSKFLIRARGKHIFNPTNVGLVLGLLLLDDAWVSPGQWGAVAFFGFFFASLGVFVVHRSRRSDVTWAFLAAWAGVLFARAWWLGDPLAIPLHQVQNGGLLIFAFFMISDPKTTPDHRYGRVLWACLIAAVAAYIQFGLYRPNGLLFALVLSAPAVPLLDRLFPAERFAWSASSSVPVPVPATATGEGQGRALLLQRTSERSPAMSRPMPQSFSAHSADQAHPVPLSARSRAVPAPRPLTRLAWIGLAAALMLLLYSATPAAAFCGFYVAKAETDLYNKASKVVIVRDGDRTVLTMANDYQGDPREFAIVIPIPTKLERDQIHVGESAVIDHLDAYTAPRLVEYFDGDPCHRLQARRFRSDIRQESMAMADDGAAQRAKSLGVEIEATYSVGEYDIQILSAKESRGLGTWLREQGYRLPDGAEPVLRSYLKQGLRFFVAKVNLEAKDRLGFSELRPLQMAFETPKFMLPIRLGTLNADGPQELFVWILTRSGRVETTNYRTVRLPSDVEIPEFVENDFGAFYRDLFAHQAEKERRRAVFLEYAWDMGWCDPCAADPLSNDQLRQLGVFWLGAQPQTDSLQRGQNVFVTRLHVSYTAESFPQDLVFQETGDRTNFQGRYILRRPWTGDARACPAAGKYFAELRQRKETRAQKLARLTGWEIGEIRRKMVMEPSPDPQSGSWWQKLWGD